MKYIDERKDGKFMKKKSVFYCSCKNLFKTRILSCIIIISLIMGMFVQTATFNAEDSLEKAEVRIEEFLQKIYSAKGIVYENFELEYVKEMYDNNNNVVAIVGIFMRDGQMDYAIYNCITETIDEYSFDCDDAFTRFEEDETLYYTGALNYYICSGNDEQMRHTNTGHAINKAVIMEKAKKFVEHSKNRRNNKSGKSSNPGNGADGIIHWSDIKNSTSGWTNSDFGYLSGITWRGSTETDGISGSGLSFSSMTSLSQNGKYKNHCGPTALTNIMVYYDWLGYNTLLNDSRKDTFEWLRVNSEHNNTEGTYLKKARLALLSYLAHMGYTSSYLTNFTDDYTDYKEAIDKDQVILTLLNVTQSDGNEWGHFVVTLGYEEFKQAYEKPVLWGTITEYRYLRYLRVCDGWSSCDENVYVDLNGFYDSYNSSAITIK